jgi:hypothetical protein
MWKIVKWIWLGEAVADEAVGCALVSLFLCNEALLIYHPPVHPHHMKQAHALPCV